MVGIEGTAGSLTATTHRAGVTAENELVTTGSVRPTVNPADPRFIISTEKIDDINNKMSVIIRHLELINDTTIKEVEIE